MKKKYHTSINSAFLIEVEKFKDERGYFMDIWNYKNFDLPRFVQDSHSHSKRGVLRGLHYQEQSQSQGKLVRCSQGAVYDVIVDLRKSSSTFGKWHGVYLDRPELLLWIPPGLAHGFYTMTNTSDLQYKFTSYYNYSSQRVLLWNDNKLKISWPLKYDPIISSKDVNQAKTFEDCDKFN